MPADRATRGRRTALRAAAAVVLSAVAVVAWVAFGRLLQLEGDERAQGLLHLAHGHSSAEWALVSLAVAASASVVLLTWLLGRAVRRAPQRHRAVATAAAVTVWLASALATVLMAACTVLLVAVQPVVTTVSGSDGTVVVTSDAFDGDVDQVWRRTGRFTYVRDAAPTTVDPQSGACELVGAVLTCGRTSQRLGPGPADGR